MRLWPRRKRTRIVEMRFVKIQVPLGASTEDFVTPVMNALHELYEQPWYLHARFVLGYETVEVEE